MSTIQSSNQTKDHLFSQHAVWCNEQLICCVLSSHFCSGPQTCMVVRVILLLGVGLGYIWSLSGHRCQSVCLSVWALWPFEAITQAGYKKKNPQLSGGWSRSNQCIISSILYKYIYIHISPWGLIKYHSIECKCDLSPKDLNKSGWISDILSSCCSSSQIHIKLFSWQVNIKISTSESVKITEQSPVIVQYSDAVSVHLLSRPSH